MGGMFVRQFCRLWVGLWVTLLSVGAVDLTQGPIVVPTATNAVVRWSTDHASGTRLYFGTDRKHIETRIDTATVTGDHEVKISGLKAGTTYWYTVGTARMPLATNSFTTAGVHDGPPEVVGPSSPTQSPTSVSKANAPPKTTPVSAFDPTQIKVPPARDTWGAPRSLQDHFDRHGADFGAKSPEDYAAKAWLFLRRAAAEHFPAKVDDDGVLRVYEAKTKTFASYNRNLTTKTFFKPGRPDYFDDQPGKPVDLKKIVK